VGEREEQLASVVHSMASPVLVVDEAGRFAMLNSAASELFRLSHAFELGQPVAGKLHNPVLESLLTGDMDVTTEVVVDAGDDGARAFRATVRRVRSNGGRVLGRLLVLDDVTADREAEQLKADFVAVIGHELRTPLTVMKGYIHTLARRGAQMDEEKRKRAYDALVSNAARLERLIEDLLFVSAIERRRVALDLESCEVGSLLATEADERVTVRHPRRNVEAAVDRGRLEQVLHHLLDNARKYSEGPIVLELADRGEEIEISVSDQGPGIYSGDIPLIFERFRQIDGSGTRAHGGLGIGLYLCRRLVEALGGRIWCESRLGVGSRFAFTLPKDGPPEATVAGPPESVAAASSVALSPRAQAAPADPADAIDVDVDAPFDPASAPDLPTATL
jgi:two-component system phosphate regulon sensor histidine kinase PhoR